MLKHLPSNSNPKGHSRQTSFLHKTGMFLFLSGKSVMLLSKPVLENASAWSKTPFFCGPESIYKW
jgi:hypothetical protein